MVSKTLHDPDWENTTVLRGPLRDDIERLKSAPGENIVTTGSITLARALMADDLVDESRLLSTRSFSESGCSQTRIGSRACA